MKYQVKSNCFTKGFTLIELLVVVLIISILAAVAVPQYQKAVAKSRVANALAIAKSLAMAEEAYYLQNGAYTYDSTLLDIEIPNCNLAENKKYLLACDNYTLIGLDRFGSVNVNYCPKYNTSESGCNTNADAKIGLRLSHYKNEQAGKNLCFPAANSKLGQIICESFGLQQL